VANSTAATRRGASKPSLRAAAPLQILRRAQHQDALDPLSVEMLEVPRVAGLGVGAKLRLSAENGNRCYLGRFPGAMIPIELTPWKALPKVNGDVQERAVSAVP